MPFAFLCVPDKKAEKFRLSKSQKLYKITRLNRLMRVHILTLFHKKSELFMKSGNYSWGVEEGEVKLISI